MDGYAVCGPPPWRVVGRFLAGSEPPPGLTPGCAAEIATGAVVPPLADAVLPYEQASRRGWMVTGVAETGRHIRRRGEDFPLGASLLPAGTVVTPAVLGLAASVGHDSLQVWRRPVVNVVVTGAEVRDVGLPGPGRVRDAIGPVLPGVVNTAGGLLGVRCSVGDDLSALVAALLEPGPDVFVVSGGTSVGAADQVRTALDAVSARVLVSGVACRPGHPQLLAQKPDGRFVVGLPGNPFAALVAGLTLLQPLLAALGGRPSPPAVIATLGAPIPPHPRDTRLVPVTLAGALALPTGHDRPGSLWGAALADALAVVPPRHTGPDVQLLPL
jgi:molybdopterin molybdotransferase